MKNRTARIVSIFFKNLTLFGDVICAPKVYTLNYMKQIGRIGKIGKVMSIAITGAIILSLVPLSAAVDSAGATDWHVNEGESIQSAIDNATAGDTIIVHEGIYEEQLYIAKSLDLKAAEGWRPEIRAPEPEGLENYSFGFKVPISKSGLLKSYLSYTPLIMVDGSSSDVSVSITNFVVDGSSITPEISEYGICGIVYFKADGIIKNNEVKNIWGEKKEPKPFKKSPFNGAGVWVIYDSNVTVRGNNVYDYRGTECHGIWVFGNGAKGMITENVVTGAGSADFPDQCGILVSMGATATVNDNIVSGHVYNEAWSYAPGIAFYEGSGSAQGNTAINNQVGIWAEVGMLSSHSTVSIKNNIVDASGLSEVECNGIVTSIMVLPLPLHGLWKATSLTATIEGNRITGGSGSGIIIGHPIRFPIVLVPPRCTVKATITENIVTDWNCGIQLLKFSDSTVYLNDFVNNTQSVVVDRSTNTWRSSIEMSYPYKGDEHTNYLGNYWSDYAGTDANNDGIGDTPYEITGGNPDRYPMME